MELNINYSYDRQIYGSQRQNKMRSTAIGGSVAWYIFAYTALEVNYTETETRINENDETVVDTTSNLKIKSTQNDITNYTWGLGIRQMLSGRKARIQPLISIGYARQFQDSSTTYNLSLNDGPTYEVLQSGPRVRTDNVFGAFILKFVLTKTMALTGSVRTTFKAFEWNEARNFVRYQAGLSWVFYGLCY